MTNTTAGRFTAAGRDFLSEEHVRLVSVGVDIGSSTTHLVFSRLVLESRGSRYVVIERSVIAESEILLTPYVSDMTIDGQALGRFFDAQYEQAGLTRDDVDTGALILTGVALQRENAQTIAELFALESGRFVAVSAGDNLEAVLAANGSGAMAMSADGDSSVMNIDIGGGTTKVVVCNAGLPTTVAALDIGARLIVTTADGTIVRLEPAGIAFGHDLGLDLELGAQVTSADLERLAAHMADRLFEHLTFSPAAAASAHLLRTEPLRQEGHIHSYTFSGGVSEYIYERSDSQFGDLGRLLGAAVRERAAARGWDVREPEAGIRATVIGASQYSVQVSGNTIFIDPASAVPLRNVPVIKPSFSFEAEPDATAVAATVRESLARYDLLESAGPVAIALRWRGSATWDRMDGFCRGVIDGLASQVSHGQPIVLVFDGDVGGLLGLHLKEEVGYPGAVISIDGIELKEFDFIDIGALIPSTGTVPVVIKSLVFPGRH